jgi:hypothetical protein
VFIWLLSQVVAVVPMFVIVVALAVLRDHKPATWLFRRLTSRLTGFRPRPYTSDHFEIDRRRSGLVRLAGGPTREPGLVKSGGGATDRMDLGASDRTARTRAQ